MIMKEIILKYLSEIESRLVKQHEEIQAKCNEKLRDYEYKDVIVNSSNLQTTTGELMLLNIIKQDIESGKFDVPKTACCGGECEKELL